MTFVDVSSSDLYEDEENSPGCDSPAPSAPSDDDYRDDGELADSVTTLDNSVINDQTASYATPPQFILSPSDTNSPQSNISSGWVPRITNSAAAIVTSPTRSRKSIPSTSFQDTTDPSPIVARTSHHNIPHEYSHRSLSFSSIRPPPLLDLQSSVPFLTSLSEPHEHESPLELSDTSPLSLATSESTLSMTKEEAALFRHYVDHLSPWVSNQCLNGCLQL